MFLYNKGSSSFNSSKLQNFQNKQNRLAKCSWIFLLIGMDVAQFLILICHFKSWTQGCPTSTNGTQIKNFTLQENTMMTPTVCKTTLLPTWWDCRKSSTAQTVYRRSARGKSLKQKNSNIVFYYISYLQAFYRNVITGHQVSWNKSEVSCWKLGRILCSNWKLGWIWPGCHHTS